MSFANRYFPLPKKLGMMAAMANWPQDAVARLGDKVRARRAELNLTQIDVWRRGGPSNSTITEIESGEGSPTAPTLQKLDLALGWPQGTAVRHLLGERMVRTHQADPRTPLEKVPTETLAEIAAEALSELRRRIVHKPDDGELDNWGRLDPGGDWPEDTDEPEDLRE